MEVWSEDDPNCDFYDSDAPGEGAELDVFARRIGWGQDLGFYRKLAAEVNGPVLELCCGTGRISLPLVRDGHTVTAADLSRCMLAQFRHKAEQLTEEQRARLTIVEGDVTQLDYDRQFALVFIPFNSLLSIASFPGQLKVLANAYAALEPGGIFAADLTNPQLVEKEASNTPRLVHQRRHLTRATRYSRFVMNGYLEPDQRQRLFGWYDEIRHDGTVVRREWEMYVRNIYRYELELMLRGAGFEDVEIWGDYSGGQFNSFQQKMVARARRPRA